MTSFQKELLKVIGRSSLGDNFYLTGGTALAAFYLQHRFSEDLDFFYGRSQCHPPGSLIPGSS
ncbi:MAG: nucleotidyl transferase AbiEii/AbiGii toxin family protein [Chloroflexi bacterium]|nr:nucleotidyl transferase AbiEii/AbiGii toxin family protein [Chloroflexota bacterium]